MWLTAGSTGRWSTTGAVYVQARPVMRAVPVAVHPSEAPLTVPEAPDLATIGRSQARQVFEEQLAIKEEKLQACDQKSDWHLIASAPYERPPGQSLEKATGRRQLCGVHTPGLVADGRCQPLNCAVVHCHLCVDPAHCCHVEAAPREGSGAAAAGAGGGQGPASEHDIQGGFSDFLREPGMHPDQPSLRVLGHFEIWPLCCAHHSRH